MKYLVTGGAGFIGSNYLHYVVNKYPNDEFVCLDDLTYAGNFANLLPIIDRGNFRFVKGNICDEKFVNELFDKEDFDVVINFAAESHVDNSIKNPGVFVDTNVLFSSFYNFPPTRQSSIARYGSSYQRNVFNPQLSSIVHLPKESNANQNKSLRPKIVLPRSIARFVSSLFI